MPTLPSFRRPFDILVELIQMSSTKVDLTRGQVLSPCYFSIKNFFTRLSYRTECPYSLKSDNNLFTVLVLQSNLSAT